MEECLDESHRGESVVGGIDLGAESNLSDNVALLLWGVVLQFRPRTLCVRGNDRQRGWNVEWSGMCKRRGRYGT
jgi:hypothetical protein